MTRLPGVIAGSPRSNAAREVGRTMRGFFAYASANGQGEEPARARTGVSVRAVIGYLVLLAVACWWAWRAFHDPYARDTGLAWQAGDLAWVTGHPEHLTTWNGMTLLAAGMAIVSRVFTAHQTADLITAVNIVLWLGLVMVLLGRTQKLLRPVWWWIAALGLVSFGPLMSTVWWKQFNVIVLALAVAGFELARRRRLKTAALLIGLSISIKPLALLLPVVMLARRETRRVGAMAIAWVIALTVVAQAFLAARAHDLATLDPTIGVRNLIHKTSAAGNLFLCNALNFSPASTLCRLNASFQYWTVQRILALGLVALLAWFVVGALRGRGALSWEVLAFSLPFSIMVGALAWPHYQVMLAPLLFLLLFRFAREGAEATEWAGLLVAFVLISLMWEPYGTVVSAITGGPVSAAQTNLVEQYAQLGQYVLVLVGLLWYWRRRPQDRPLA
jgi:Glycosyltransferase family 87